MPRTLSPLSPADEKKNDQLLLPLERITVRIPVAIEMTGIGRSKLYELIAAGDIEAVKIGASTLITVASLRRLIQKAKRSQALSADAETGP